MCNRKTLTKEKKEIDAEVTSREIEKARKEGEKRKLDLSDQKLSSQIESKQFV